MCFCGKKHLGKCLAGTDGCFGYGNEGHKIRHIRRVKEKGKDFNQDPQGCIEPNSPKKNYPYVMGARKEN